MTELQQQILAILREHARASSDGLAAHQIAERMTQGSYRQPAVRELRDRILAALQELHEQDPALLQIEMKYYHARGGQDWLDSSWSVQPS